MVVTVSSRNTWSDGQQCLQRDIGAPKVRFPDGGIGGGGGTDGCGRVSLSSHGCISGSHPPHVEQQQDPQTQTVPLARIEIEQPTCLGSVVPPRQALVKMRYFREVLVEEQDFLDT